MGKKIQIAAPPVLLYVVRVSRLGNQSYGRSIRDIKSAVSEIMQKSMDSSDVHDRYNRAFEIEVVKFSTKEERAAFQKGYEMSAGKTHDPKWPLLRFFNGEDIVATRAPTVSDLAPVPLHPDDLDTNSSSEFDDSDDSVDSDDSEDPEQSTSQSESSGDDEPDDGEDIEDTDESDSDDI
jgi:hypothetical protein